VLLALPPADHLLIERDRGQFVPSRRRRRMANVRAESLLKIPAQPSPELRIPGAAAHMRMVSVAEIRRGSAKSARAFKGIICDDISEFESHMPSHAVRSLKGTRARSKFPLSKSFLRRRRENGYPAGRVWARPVAGSELAPIALSSSCTMCIWTRSRCRSTSNDGGTFSARTADRISAIRLS
jgi:hypothetical protein